MSVNPQRRKGVTYSAVFHGVLLLFVIFGLPTILHFSDPPEPQAITVELLPISEMSNVKPAEPKPEPKKPEPPKEKEQKKPSPPVKSETAPPPPKEKPAEIKKPKEEPKKEPVKKPDEKKDEKKSKPKEDDLAAILKAVRETAQKEKQDKEKSQTDKSQENNKSDRYDESMPLSLSEKDAIRNQIQKCWNVPAGAKDAQELIIVLRIELNQDGSLLRADLADASLNRYASDPFFRAAADSAIRAVRQCSPLKNLSPEKYNTWRDMELTFNPKDMLL